VKNILIYSDRPELAAELISAGRFVAAATGGALRALSVGDADLAAFLSSRGIDVLEMNPEGSPLPDPAQMAAALRGAAERTDAGVVLLSSNRRGKEIAGRLAQEMGAGGLTDIGRLEAAEGRITGVRYALGGATEVFQTVVTERQVLALRPGVFPAASEAGPGAVESLEVGLPEPRVRLRGTSAKAGDAVDIERAEVLVVVGQGLADREDLALAEKIAQALGGEVACTKPVATDRRWLPEDRIVGLSGKTCRPALALLLGVSGQVQFTVGIRDAVTIAAVNRDDQAPVASLSDYFLPADLKRVLPELAGKFPRP
jgi:electron transfer flavoprotein alpha subunit